MKKTVGMMLALGLACAANAGISLYGDGDDYDSTSKDWLSNTTDDIDGNGLGTDGYIFFGEFVETPPGNNTNPGNDQNENIFGANQLSTNLITVSQPGYISTAATGADSGNIGRYTYEAIDSPLLGDGTDRDAGNLLITGTGASALEFTVSGLVAGTTVRVGVLGAVLNDDNRARFDAPTIGLTDGIDTLYVTNLPNLSGSSGTLGWVFFDVDSDGDYTISVPPDADGVDPDVTGLGGVTFDSLLESDGSTLVLAPTSLSLDLVAPDTSIDGTITASYFAGDVTSGDIEIVSYVADSGFSAVVADPTLGTGDTEEAITVTFDNSSIGLQNGESTNSTLIVTWQEIGVGVINTLNVPLDVTYINEPSSIELTPPSLSLTLNSTDTSTNDTVVASFVPGTLATDVEIISVVMTNGFSVSPDSFILSAVTTNENITVTYVNSGGLVNHGDTADSTLVVMWTEVGSGVTNTANGAVDVSYVNVEAVPVETTTDGTYFEISATDKRINPDLVRIGGNNDETFEFVGLMTFDLSAYSAAELQSSVFTLNFTLGTQDNSPPLTDLTIEYIGTVADAEFTVENAEAWTLAGTVNTIYSGAETAGAKSYDAGIHTDNFDNPYAVFRFTKSFEGNQWNIPNGTATLAVIPAPTAPVVDDLSISVVPGGSEIVLTWSSVASPSTYAVEETDDLVFGTWSPVRTGILGNNSVLSITNAITGGQQFFRAFGE